MARHSAFSFVILFLTGLLHRRSSNGFSPARTPFAPFIVKPSHDNISYPDRSFDNVLFSSPGPVEQQKDGTSGSDGDSNKFIKEIALPPKNSGLVARIKCESVMNVPSELIEVRYDLPFGLDVEPQGGLAVCTKANASTSTNGNSEKPGDVLRYSSAWSMGLPRGDGLLTQGGAFAGSLSWQCSLFDVLKAKAWQQVVEALTSNTKDRTDEVVLVFERALPQEE